MNCQKYDGTIHPDEWIKDIQSYCNSHLKKVTNINYAISLVNGSIKLPSGITNFEKLRNALKEDISFKVFKNTNKMKLQLLEYIPEREGGETSKFISNFRQLCYNAEITDIEEQKRYLYLSIPNDYILNELYKKWKSIKSTNELIEELGNIFIDESNLIRNGSIIALKHFATGKYLSSIEDLHYTTGSKFQLVFTKDLFDSDAFWQITISNYKDLVLYADKFINLQHINSNKFLGMYQGYVRSPATKHTEVNCSDDKFQWEFNNSKLENYQGYLKSNDIINLSTYSQQQVFLRSHDFQFTIGNDTFQEVACHNERLGGNDEFPISTVITPSGG
ncbi:19813_t:CDS:2 [Funneliformis geosporum]|uniref:19813_t:CDS:1 n=1 Tax=Funneliformis geosporum TaxID=1117311 RepID=A0A9W4SG33_9GLOM|nr:19813_t:CDS:2 [Funneliformis geosporum]